MRIMESLTAAASFTLLTLRVETEDKGEDEEEEEEVGEEEDLESIPSCSIPSMPAIRIVIASEAIWITLPTTKAGLRTKYDAMSVEL